MLEIVKLAQTATKTEKLEINLQQDEDYTLRVFDMLYSHIMLTIVREIIFLLSKMNKKLNLCTYTYVETMSQFAVKSSVIYKFSCYKMIDHCEGFLY